MSHKMKYITWTLGDNPWKHIYNVGYRLHTEGWAPKNWCFWAVMLEKILEGPLDCKEIQPLSPQGNQSWIFTGRTDAEAEAPVLWPLDAKSRFIGYHSDAEKDWRRGEGDDRGWDDCMASLTQWTWFWVSLGVGDGQGSLVCCSPWGHNSWTRLNDWTELSD